MVIKGTVHNGHINIEAAALPDGTEVLITPINTQDSNTIPENDLTELKAEILRIASLACENESTDGSLAQTTTNSYMEAERGIR